MSYIPCVTNYLVHSDHQSGANKFDNPNRVKSKYNWHSQKIIMKDQNKYSVNRSTPMPNILGHMIFTEALGSPNINQNTAKKSFCKFASLSGNVLNTL